MNLAANLVTAFVALSHLGFLVLEMFFWNHPVGWRIFAMTPETAASSAVLAANQGLYNGFLAAGLAWGLIAGRRDVKSFFLGCVIVAGIFGALQALDPVHPGPARGRRPAACADGLAREE